MTRPSPRSRRGLTLLEVVLALAILTGAFAALAQLVGIGVRAARSGRELTRAQLIAESLLSEISAGIVAADTLNAVPVETNPGWLVSAVVDSTPYNGVIQVTVIAEQDSQSRRRVRFSVTRWMRDPNLAIPEEPTQEDSSASGSSSASGGGETGGGAGGGGGTGAGGTGGGATGGATGGTGGGAGGGGAGGGGAGGGGAAGAGGNQPTGGGR